MEKVKVVSIWDVDPDDPQGRTYGEIAQYEYLHANGRYYEMQHCGGLDEALKTKKPITEAEFNQRLKDYKYYCFDKRIGCHRYILKDIPNNYKKQTIWLLKECSFDS